MSATDSSQGVVNPRAETKTDHRRRPIVHGEQYAYQKHRCRCEVCKEGNALRQKLYQERRKMREMVGKDAMQCLCWCQETTLGVTPDEIRAGKTRTCGLPGCDERVLL